MFLNSFNKYMLDEYYVTYAMCCICGKVLSKKAESIAI